MDWDRAIERNRAALKRVLAAIAAMLAVGRPEGCTTMQRGLHRAVLRLLRPAEAAARRLVIIAARGMVLPLRALAARSESVRRRKRRDQARLQSGGLARPARLCLPLFDRLPDFGPRRSASGVPRISVPGLTVRIPVAPRRVPRRSDPIDATRLDLRLSAVAAALDDLPGQAKRFARWRARLDAARRDEASAGSGAVADATRAKTRRPARIRRYRPLRFGRPPGLDRSRHAHEVHEVLAELHALALDAMRAPDTS